MINDSLIAKVLGDLFPGWEHPRDTGQEWQLTLCPFHGDKNPSASISFELGGFACHACGVKGDAVGLLMKHKEMSYSEAVEYAKTISPGCDVGVQRKPKGKSGRRVFGQPRADRERVESGGEVQVGVRKRTPPWAQ